MSRFASVVLATGFASVLAACAPAEPVAEDGRDDTFLGEDGKADAFGIAERSPEAWGILAVVNTLPSAEELSSAARVPASAAHGLIAHRAGEDGVLGTADDDLFQSLAEIDAVPRTGARTFKALLAFAQEGGYVEGAQPPPGMEQLTINDVAVLFPLPSSGDGAPLWPASLDAKGGALLPRSRVDQIEVTLFREVEAHRQYDRLRVVGLRLDPCFQTALDGPCQAQLRLVFQAMQDGVAFDGAVHALYNLDPVALAELVDELGKLRALTPENLDGLPLGVSPALLAQGTASAYFDQLRAAVVRAVGASNLTRMTFMTRTLARESSWQFGGFHIREDRDTGFPAPGPIEIGGTRETLQLVTSVSGPRYRYTVRPGLVDPAGELGLSHRALEDADRAARKDAHAWAVRQEDPVATLPDTADCASCHLAMHPRRILEGLEKTLLGDAIFAARAPVRTSDATESRDNLRAFGWFDASPAISQRTANEAQASVRTLRSR